jgi:hypothetical protein
MHTSAMLFLAVRGCTFKYMDSMAVNIFDIRGASKEDVDW